MTRVDEVGPNPMYKYQGFIPDLIRALSKRLHFNYEWYNVSADYGHLDDKTYRWTGMIGEVTRRDVRVMLVLSLYFSNTLIHVSSMIARFRVPFYSASPV